VSSSHPFSHLQNEPKRKKISETFLRFAAPVLITMPKEATPFEIENVLRSLAFGHKQTKKAGLNDPAYLSCSCLCRLSAVVQDLLEFSKQVRILKAFFQVGHLFAHFFSGHILEWMPIDVTVALD
jgi:hypothetical protein